MTALRPLDIHLALIPVVDEVSFAELSPDQRERLGGETHEEHLAAANLLIEDAIAQNLPALVVPLTYDDVHMTSHRLGVDIDSRSLVDAASRTLLTEGSAHLWMGSAENFLDAHEEVQEEAFQEEMKEQVMIALEEASETHSEEELTASFERVDHVLSCIFETHGHYHLTAATDDLAHTIHVTSNEEGTEVDGDDLFFPTLSLALLDGGRLMMRTVTEEEHAVFEVPISVVCGWEVKDGGLRPLTEGEVFALYNTDPLTGEPLAPEEGLEYRSGFHVDA